MTTPFQAWQTEAMRLADNYAELTSDQNDDCCPAPRPTDAQIDAARAALYAHLLAAPIGDRPEPQKLPASLNTCSELLRLAGKPYPRTCSECGLGPCKHRTQLDEQGRLTKPEGMA